MGANFKGLNLRFLFGFLGRYQGTLMEDRDMVLLEESVPDPQ